MQQSSRRPANASYVKGHGCNHQSNSNEIYMGSFYVVQKPFAERGEGWGAFRTQGCRDQGDEELVDDPGAQVCKVSEISPQPELQQNIQASSLLQDIGHNDCCAWQSIGSSRP